MEQYDEGFACIRNNTPERMSPMFKDWWDDLKKDFYANLIKDLEDGKHIITGEKVG